MHKVKTVAVAGVWLRTVGLAARQSMDSVMVCFRPAVGVAGDFVGPRL